MSSGVGLADEPTSANAVLGLAALRPRAWTFTGSENVPLTRCPVATELGSATLSSASPADEMTFAVEDAV